MGTHTNNKFSAPVQSLGCFSLLLLSMPARTSALQLNHLVINSAVGTGGGAGGGHVPPLF